MAELLDMHLMEWTLDQERLYENPLMTLGGQAAIRVLCEKHGVAIPSLTGDCFMQAPFWKTEGIARESLEGDFLAVVQACAVLGISIVVVPLVDNGRLENIAQEDALVAFLQVQAGFLEELGIKVVFESDFAPTDLSRFIARLNPVVFGINYDIGNSAALGYNPHDEITAYGDRIVNVHVKDRLLGGTTVPLGVGNANFENVFAELARIEYSGNYILQTARAADGEHAYTLARYRDMVSDWLSCYTVHAA